MQSTTQQVVERNRELVHRIAAGDPSAESELISHYIRSIRLILLKRTGQPHLVNDFCQDTFVVILRKLRAGELRNANSLPAFIHQIAINISIQHFRKESRYVTFTDEILESLTAHSHEQGEKLDLATARNILESILDQLTMTRDRQILRRFYLRGDDKTEICRDLELSSLHFDRVLFRAKQRMRELIDQKEGLKALLLGGLPDA